MTGWLTVSLTNRPPNWTTVWLTDWLIDGLTGWPTNRQTHWLTDWLTDRPNPWLTGWLTDSLTDQLIDQLNHSLTDWLTDRSTNWLIDISRQHSLLTCTHLHWLVGDILDGKTFQFVLTLWEENIYKISLVNRRLSERTQFRPHTRIEPKNSTTSSTRFCVVF